MDKTLKLLALQHVSVFHKTILKELFVPVKVTYVHYYFRSMLAACHILFVLGLDFMLLVFLVLTSSVRACHAWYNYNNTCVTNHFWQVFLPPIKIF